MLHYQNEKWHCRRHESYRRSTSVLVLHASSAESRSGNTAECRERCSKLRVGIRDVSIIVESSDDESRIIEANDFSHMKVVGTDNRINSMGNNIIFEVNSRDREYFQVLMPDSTRPDAFRRLPAEYDNLVPRADMINDLRNAEQIEFMMTLSTRDQFM